MPVTPMFASIMTTEARTLVKKLCKIKNIQGHTHDSPVLVLRESNWNHGSGNDNLEESALSVGVVGMVVGVAQPTTVLRFLVSGNERIEGTYHVSVMNLEPLEEKL